MARVLLVAATTGYQTRSFMEAAQRLDVGLLLATDRCHVLDDPWQDRAVPIRFHDEAVSVQTIVEAAAERPLDGVLAIGDRPAVVGAAAAAALALPTSPPDAVRAAGHKLLTRLRLREGGLPTPWFTRVGLDDDWAAVAHRVEFPCVVKPLVLAGSRGVMRADTAEQLGRAMARVRDVMRMPDVRSERDPAHDAMLVEGYVPGHEVAVEGVVTDGRLQVLAIFDKPDPLEGPFFEETIYVTPPPLSPRLARDVRTAVAEAARALGLTRGPIHAECRLSPDGVVVLEVAARPIGGLCGRTLRFHGGAPGTVSLETVLLEHACGQSVTHYRREQSASGVMMIPIPGDGVFKGVDGVDRALSVEPVREVVITAKPDQRLRPVPEGGSYLGFIFAKADGYDQVVAGLREAHRRLRVELVPAIPVGR